MNRLFQALYDIGCAILVTLPLFLIGMLVAILLIAAVSPATAATTFTMTNVTDGVQVAPNVIVHFTDTSSPASTSWSWRYYRLANTYEGEPAATITFSTVTNPTETFGAGNFSVYLVSNAGTATAKWINVSAGKTRDGLTADDVRFYPRDHIFNTNISTLPILPNSSSFLSTMNYATADLMYGRTMGLNVVDNNVSESAFYKRNYQAAKSFAGAPIQIPDLFNMQHMRDPSNDHHMWVVNPDNNTFMWAYQGSDPLVDNGTYSANSYWVTNLSDYFIRDFWGARTMPPLLLRNESIAGDVTHMTSVAVGQSGSGLPWWPVYSDAGKIAGGPPCGAIMRLNKSYDVSSYNETQRHILNGLKNYGLIVVDNSGSMYQMHVFAENASASNAAGWNISTLTFTDLTPQDFEFVDVTSLMISRTSGQVKLATADNIPPLNITSLNNETPTTSSVNMTWVAPQDKYLDFDHVRIYKDNAWVTNVTYNYIMRKNSMFYNVTGLSESTAYLVSASACDYHGNCNVTHWLNKSVTTNGAAPTGSAPEADLSASPLSGGTPLSVQFVDESYNIPTTWLWTFGDGGTSTLSNPEHTYNAAGTYTVSLYVTNAYGSDTVTKTNYITVTPSYSASLLPSQHGYVSRTRANNSWSELLALPGNETTSNYTVAKIQITAANAPDGNYTLNRWIYLTYNMTLLGIPSNAIIESARIDAYSTADYNEGFSDWQVMVVESGHSVPAVNGDYDDYTTTVVSNCQTYEDVSTVGYHNFTIESNSSIPKSGWYKVAIITSQQKDEAINWSSAVTENYWIDTATYTPNLTITWAPYQPSDNILLLIINYIKQFLHLGGRLIT